MGPVHTALPRADHWQCAAPFSWSTTAIVALTRDVRVCDDPTPAATCEQADLVVRLLAVDARLISAAPNHALMGSGSRPSPHARDRRQGPPSWL